MDGGRACGVRVGAEIVEAPLVVDATGRASLLATRLGAKTRLRGLDASAIYAHFRGPSPYEGDQRGDIVIVMGERGWAWIIPFKDDHASIGIVVDRAWMAERGRDESMDDFFARSLSVWPRAHALFERFAREGPVRSAANFSYGVSDVSGDGWLCVGDAFGFIDPLFSSGAHMAMRGAALAAEAIDDALRACDTSAPRFDAYVATMRAASETFIGVVRATYDGDFREVLFADPQRPVLRKVITSVLGGDVVHQRAPTWLRFVRDRYPA
jgi:flavin-dependent dehydrogenase